MTELTDDFLERMLYIRDNNTKRLSYADLAEKYLNNRALGDTLRSALRVYKKRNGIHTILDPIDRLFDDPIYIDDYATLIISDTHAPYQNKRLLLAAFKKAKYFQCKQMIHAGDLIDAASYNSQARNEVVSSFETDISHARSILYTARTHFDKVYILPGNHDMYPMKKLKISFADLIHTILDNKYIDQFITTEYDYVYYSDFAMIGHLSSGYDPVPGRVAADIADKYNLHALVGHDHLFGAMRGKSAKWGISIGGMFMLNRFWYQARAFNTFPHNACGFAIIKDGRIHHFDSMLEETIYE